MKRIFAFVISLILIASMVGCEKYGFDTQSPLLPTHAHDDTNTSSDFQKNMHQSTTDYLCFACEAENGIYFQLDAYVYYLEKATSKVTILCAKPECEHNDKTCNARLSARSLWFYNGKLYFFNGNKIIENGQVVDYGDRIYSIDPDGTNRQAVQDLEFVPSGDALAAGQKEPILHRGITYFTYSGVLYALPLGGNIEDAQAIWGEEIKNDGTHIGDVNRLTYKLWADGDFVYFMVNLPQEVGTYKDTLFSYDTNTKEVTQIWQTPDAGDVGEWITTGVSVSQWYVMDGNIYFYLSGGDFWRCDLETGETLKLADTHRKVEFGSAVFTDECLCIMNDAPEQKNAVSSYGTQEYIGGNTVYVYGLDGTFIKELSLKTLYDEFDTLAHCALTFCTGDNIYFLADASTWSDPAGGVSHIISNRILCCVNIETGKITQIYSW